jgi:hypothetical protein
MNILASGTELYSLHWYAQNSDATMHALANLPTRLILLRWSLLYILEKEKLFMTYDKRKILLTRLRKDVCQENTLRGQVYLIIQEDNSRKGNIEHSKKNTADQFLTALIYTVINRTG